MKTPNFLKLTAAALFLVAATASAGTIEGTRHDLSGATWTGGEICIVCHAAHNNVNAAGEMLWNHTMSAETNYTLYTSPTFSQGPGNQPSGSSKLCLSCHDGTIAVDSFGGTGSGGTEWFLSGNKSFGTDLSNDHPISFAYTPGPGQELNPTNTDVVFGDGSSGSIADMLFGADVECSSCHDVHNTKAAPDTPLLLVNNVGSALCLTCHIK